MGEDLLGRMAHWRTMMRRAPLHDPLLALPRLQVEPSVHQPDLMMLMVEEAALVLSRSSLQVLE